MIVADIAILINIITNNMAEEKKLTSTSFEWTVPEYATYERSGKWYTGLGIFALIFILYALFTGNFLFAIIILLFIFIVVMRDFFPPKKLPVTINTKGVAVGPHFYEFRDIRDFYIIYEPPETKYLYLNFKSLSPAIAIELDDQNPIELRKFMLNFALEDLEKEEERFVETISRAFKI